MQKFLSLALAFFGLIYSGTAQTALPTSWNFSTPPITSPPVGWNPAVGTNGALTYQFGIGDGTSCRLDATGEFLQIFFADRPGKLSYYLSPQNAGAAWGGKFSTLQSVDGITWDTVRSVTSKSTTSTNFTGSKYIDDLNDASRYVRFLFVRKLSGGNPNVPGGNMALDSVLIKAAPAAPAASINIKQGNNTIVNQGNYTVGTTNTNIFIIENKGSVQALTIDSIRFDGPAASDFSAPTPPSSIAALTNQNLNINFTPGGLGSRIARLKVYNSDPSKNPYIINLYGIGGNFATEPVSAPASLNLTNTTSFGFKLGINAANPTPEKYIILRKKDSPVTDVPSDGITYKVGDIVGSATVAYVGDSAISNLRPSYIFANSTYHFSAFSFNGPIGFENYLTNSLVSGSTQTLGKQPGNYYSGINPDSSSFLLDLHNKINPHDTIFYSLMASRLIMPFTARDTSGGRKVVNCVYTNASQIYEGSFIWAASNNNAVLTREHTWAQSLMPSNIPPSGNWPNGSDGKELPEYNDLHHLFPTHQNNANVVRSNLPFDVVASNAQVSPTGRGKKGTSSSGQTVYEPQDSNKGDVARAMMYMAVCYNGILNRSWKFPGNQSPAVLMQWHQQDPPSDFEIARHEYIFSQQKNRNPFIDNPDWANSINFANMTFLPTSVEKVVFENSVLTFPNPATERVFVDATLIFTSGMTFELQNITGRTVSNGELGSAMTEINMPKEPGIYFLKLTSEKGTFTSRLIKK